MDGEGDVRRRSVVFVDDEPAFRSLAAHAIESFGFNVRSVADAETARDAVARTSPDLLIADLALGEGPSGLDLVNYVRRHYPYVAVLVLTAFRSPDLVDSASFGIGDDVGYFVKSDLVDLSVLRQAIEDTLNEHPPRPVQRGPLEITSTQAEVLRLIAEGKSNTAIAAQRHCSVRSLERLISRLYQALGLTDDQEMNPRVAAARIYQQSQVTVR